MARIITLMAETMLATSGTRWGAEVAGGEEVGRKLYTGRVCASN